MFNGEVILKSQQRFKIDHHKVCTEEVNKIALSSDDDKRLQTFDGIETYPYGTTHLKCVKAKWWWWEICLSVKKKYVDCPFYGEILLKQ